MAIQSYLKVYDCEKEENRKFFRKNVCYYNHIVCKCNFERQGMFRTQLINIPYDDDFYTALYAINFVRIMNTEECKCNFIILVKTFLKSSRHVFREFKVKQLHI